MHHRTCLLELNYNQHLGFVLIVRKSRNQEAVLLGNHKSDALQDGAAKESSKPQESGTVMVKLLTATKVPAGHRKAQKQQKKMHDQHARPPNFTVGERIFLFKPAERTGEKHKLARAYHGPYRVIKLTPNNAHIRRANRPEGEILLVALDRLKKCPDEVSDTYWPPDHPTTNQTTSQKKR